MSKAKRISSARYYLDWARAGFPKRRKGTKAFRKKRR